jgi:hypothetical protein
MGRERRWESTKRPEKNEAVTSCKVGIVQMAVSDFQNISDHAPVRYDRGCGNVTLTRMTNNRTDRRKR